jgi:hypothetical protein
MGRAIAARQAPIVACRVLTDALSAVPHKLMAIAGVDAVETTALDCSHSSAKWAQTVDRRRRSGRPRMKPDHAAFNDAFPE